MIAERTPSERGAHVRERLPNKEPDDPGIVRERWTNDSVRSAALVVGAQLSDGAMGGHCWRAGGGRMPLQGPAFVAGGPTAGRCACGRWWPPPTRRSEGGAPGFWR